MGIEILPPDVNLSDHEFVVVDGNIRFGLDAVKGVGYAAVEAIKAARDEGGPFTSLWDFCERVDGRAVNKKAIEALIKCGAFGSTGATRRGHARGARVRAGAPARRPSSTRRSARARSSTSAASATSGAGRRSPARAPADPDRGVRPRRAAGDREGVDRPVHHRASAQARARGAARARATRRAPRCPTARDGEWVKVGGMISASQEDQDPLGLDGDVRDARRPRRPGRAARVREGDPGQRGRAAARPDRARPRHRRPRRERQGLRQGRRRHAVRPVRGGDRARARAGRGAGRRPRAAAAAACASTPAACRRR